MICIEILLLYFEGNYVIRNIFDDKRNYSWIGHFSEKLHKGVGVVLNLGLQKVVDQIGAFLCFIY